MGKKKRGHPDLEDLLARPWCYYCERDFDDLKILISHQKAKHFKCDKCGRRLNTAGGLSVHLNQVHKENLAGVENALPNRSNLDVEIFGMEGIPDEVVQAHNQRVITQYQQAEAERRSATGNPAPGGNPGNAAKKPKFESPAELKRRLAEHKAKLAEEQVGGSGSGTPNGFSHSTHSPGLRQSPGPYATSPPVYTQNAVPTHPPFSQMPSQSVFAPPQNLLYHAQAFGNSSLQAGSPVSPLPLTHPPSSNHSIPHPAPVLPPTGLPQRPSFGAQHVNNFQLQQMHRVHQGQGPQERSVEKSSRTSSSGGPGIAKAEHQEPSSLDDLVSRASRSAADVPNQPAIQVTLEKPSKKEKGSKLMYSDNEISPEEKRATVAKYASVSME